MNKEVLSRIILENQDLILNKKLIERDYHVPDLPHIKVFTGIRRAGKTHVLYQYAKKIPIEKVLFLDFEDERLLELNFLSNYDLIIDTYKQLYPENKPVLFFDEIQNLKNWHLYLKRLHVQGYKIYVTGSNANMISSEIATYLKGRSIETQVFPFSFKEFLQLKNIRFDNKTIITKEPFFLNLFDQYMEMGGFPEVILSNTIDKRTVAANIFDLLFYKDLIARYDKNHYLLKLVINKIVENLTKEFSIASIYKRINPIYRTSNQTVNEYFNILPEAFLTKSIFAYKTSFQSRQSKRKTYVGDNSFIFLNRITKDYSRLFENLVFNHLQRKYQEDIFYYKTQNFKEVDFYIQNYHTKLLIQVSYAIQNPVTKKREISALVKAMEELKITKAYIYTYNESERITINNLSIEVVPFWKIDLTETFSIR